MLIDDIFNTYGRRPGDVARHLVKSVPVADLPAAASRWLDRYGKDPLSAPLAADEARAVLGLMRTDQNLNAAFRALLKAAEKEVTRLDPYWGQLAPMIETWLVDFLSFLWKRRSEPPAWEERFLIWADARRPAIRNGQNPVTECLWAMPRDLGLHVRFAIAASDAWTESELAPPNERDNLRLLLDDFVLRAACKTSDAAAASRLAPEESEILDRITPDRIRTSSLHLTAVEVAHSHPWDALPSVVRRLVDEGLSSADDHKSALAIRLLAASAKPPIDPMSEIEKIIANPTRMPYGLLGFLAHAFVGPGWGANAIPKRFSGSAAALIRRGLWPRHWPQSLASVDTYWWHERSVRGEIPGERLWIVEQETLAEALARIAKDPSIDVTDRRRALVALRKLSWPRIAGSLAALKRDPDVEADARETLAALEKTNRGHGLNVETAIDLALFAVGIHQE